MIFTVFTYVLNIGTKITLRVNSFGFRSAFTAKLHGSILDVTPKLFHFHVNADGMVMKCEFCGKY